MRSCTLGCAVLSAVLCLPAYGMATESALMQAPARNAALIAKVPGFKSATLKLYYGERAISEGVLIRKSAIKDGKIVIPPAGLVYSSRIGSIGTMTGIEVMLLGKQYSEVDERHEYLVIRNVTMKKGDSINLLPDGSRALQFVSSSTHPYGSAGDSATLRIMKSTGNFYGTNFVVATNPVLTDVNSGTFHGMGLESGRHPVTEQTDEPLQHQSYYGNSIYPSGKSYLVAGKVTAKEVEVKEFATPSLTDLWLTKSPRITGSYAAGDTVVLGDCTLKVASIGKDSATLTLTGKDGSTQSREFTNLLAPTAKDYLPSSPAERARYQMASADGKVRVQVAMLHPEGVLTAEGKIRLDMYQDVFTLKSGQTWPGDKRFTVRPDT